MRSSARQYGLQILVSGVTTVYGPSAISWGRLWRTQQSSYFYSLHFSSSAAHLTLCMHGHIEGLLCVQSSWLLPACRPQACFGLVALGTIWYTKCCNKAINLKGSGSILYLCCWSQGSALHSQGRYIQDCSHKSKCRQPHPKNVMWESSN